MRHVSRTGVLVSATLLIVATGCATKGWVREEMGKQEAQVGQRIGQVDERIGSEAQRVDKRVDSVDKRVDTVEGRVSQEAQKTDGMGARVGPSRHRSPRPARPREEPVSVPTPRWPRPRASTAV